MEIKLDPVVAALMPEDHSFRKTLDDYNEKHLLMSNDDRVAVIAKAHERNASRADQAVYAQALERRIQLSVHATNYMLPLFAMETMSPGDPFLVEVVNIKDQKFNVLETSEFGEAPRQSYAKENNATFYHPDRYATGMLTYPIIHGYKGLIDVFDEVSSDVARAWDNNTNDVLDPFLKTVIGAYPANTYDLDTRMVSGTFPTTNELTSTGEGAFTLEIFKDLVDHFNRWGRNLKTIIINPTEQRDLWDWQHVVSTAASGTQDGRKIVTTRIKDDIMMDGRPMGKMLGAEVTWILDPTQPLKYALAFAEGPAGTFYEWPHMGGITMYDRKEAKMAGYGDNVQAIERDGHWKALIVGQDPLNYARIQFDT